MYTYQRSSIYPDINHTYGQPLWSGAVRHLLPNSACLPSGGILLCPRRCWRHYASSYGSTLTCSVIRHHLRVWPSTVLVHLHTWANDNTYPFQLRSSHCLTRQTASARIEHIPHSTPQDYPTLKIALRLHHTYQQWALAIGSRKQHIQIHYLG